MIFTKKLHFFYIKITFFASIVNILSLIIYWTGFKAMIQILLYV